MARKVDVLNAIAGGLGYEGDAPTGVVGAINAIVETMGGESDAKSVAEAIKALGPYIGGGGSGGGGAASAVLFIASTSGGDYVNGTVFYTFTGGYPACKQLTYSGYDELSIGGAHYRFESSTGLTGATVKFGNATDGYESLDSSVTTHSDDEETYWAIEFDVPAVPIESGYTEKYGQPYPKNEVIITI